ncbi:MAG: hypothetical protein HZB16_16875 [Armatimonadetes bacterium]|nr:hypothetical protein [Armatimonadota bacterium]
MFPDEALTNQFRRVGLALGRDERRGCLRADLDVESGHWELLVWLDTQDGDLLLLVPHYLRAPRREQDSAARARLCERLLALNYDLALGCFELDPADGEVRFRLAVPLGDQPAGEAALARAVAAVRYALDEAWAPCQRALFALDEPAA